MEGRHLRVVLRKGKLYLVNPEGFEDELQPQEDGSFKTDLEQLRFWGPDIFSLRFPR
jgi:hypothetical protein